MQDLKYATLATVSRCGMVWFSEDVLSTEMIFDNYLSRLRNIPLEEADDDSFGSFVGQKSTEPLPEDEISPSMQVSFTFNKFLTPVIIFFFRTMNFLNTGVPQNQCPSLSL